MWILYRWMWFNRADKFHLLWCSVVHHRGFWQLLDTCSALLFFFSFLPGESSRITRGLPEQWIFQLLHHVISRAPCPNLWHLCWWEHPVHGSPAAAEGQASNSFHAWRREGKSWLIFHFKQNKTKTDHFFEASCASDVCPGDFLQIVKFCQPGHERVSPPGDVDIGIYQLQRSEKLLGERVQKLGVEADRSDSDLNF